MNVSISGANPFAGAGALANLSFNVTGAPGLSSPVYFITFQYNAGPACGTASDGSVTVVAGTITGTVTYGNIISAPSTRLIPNVLISGAGSPPVSTLTNGSGTYALNGFGPGGYSISASKTGGVNGAVTGFDAATVAQYVVNLTTLNANQLIVADVSGMSGVSSFDATLIARYAAGINAPAGRAGSWIFNPTSYSHQNVYSNVTNENFTALLMGDVSANWNAPGPIPNPRNSDASGPERPAIVTVPSITAQAGGEVNVPLRIEGAAKIDVVAYEFELSYDPAVLQPQAKPVELSGSVSSHLKAIANTTEPGLLRVVVFGPFPLIGDGMLLNLKFDVIGEQGSSSLLRLERMMLNEGDPAVTAIDGRVEIAASPDQADM